MSAPRVVFLSDSTVMLGTALQQLQPISMQPKKLRFFKKHSPKEVKSSHQEEILSTATKIDSLIKNVTFNTKLDEQLSEIRVLINSMKDKKEDGVVNKFLMVANQCVDEIVNCSSTLLEMASLYNNIEEYRTSRTSESEHEIKAEINSWVKCFRFTEDPVAKVNIYQGLLVLDQYINSHKILSDKFSKTIRDALDSLSEPYLKLRLHMRYEERMKEIDKTEGDFVKEDEMKQIASTSQSVIYKLNRDIDTVKKTIKTEYNLVTIIENEFVHTIDEELQTTTELQAKSDNPDEESETTAKLREKLNMHSHALESADSEISLLKHIKNSLMQYHNEIFAEAYAGKYSALSSYIDYARSLEDFVNPNLHKYEFADKLQTLMYDLLDLVTDKTITNAYNKFKKSTIGSYINEFKSLDTRTTNPVEREKLKNKLNKILEDKNISQTDKDKLITFKPSFRGASRLEILAMMLSDEDFLNLRQNIQSFAEKYPKKTAKVASFIQILETQPLEVNPKAEATKQTQEVKVEPQKVNAKKLKAFDKSVTEVPTDYRFPDRDQVVKLEDKQSSKKRI